MSGSTIQIILVGVLFVALAALMCIGFGFLIINTPPTDYNVTYKTLDGDPTLHDQVYEVMIIDGVNRSYVEKALLLVPNEFGFVIVDEDPARYGPAGWVDFPDVPFPNTDQTYLIVIANITKYQNCVHNGDLIARGWTVPPAGRTVVLMDECTCPEIRLSEIIEHECAHNVELTPKLDNFPANVLQYNGWLRAVGYGSYPDNPRTWIPIYNKFVIDEYLAAEWAGGAA